MSYYNRDYKKLKLSKMKYLNSGENAQVFFDEKIIFKEYYSETLLNYRLSPEMFDILRTIINPHFIELIDVYSDFNLLELIQRKMNMVPFITDAYIAKYYSEDISNVLFIHKDYLLDNFRELELLFDIFTNNSICVDDIKRKNALLNSNNIIIIDPDTFYVTNRSIDIIRIENKKKLLNLFRSICFDGVKSLDNYGKLITMIDTDLVDIDVTKNIDLTHELSKKLKYVSKPIDFFKQ